MAEVEAGQAPAEGQEQQQQDLTQGAEGTAQPAAPSKTYSQEEVDRILNKVRKNARYLGRKEAEAELLRQGVTPKQAQEAVERQADKPSGGAPKREDFEHYEDFLVAKADHTARQASREEREKEEKAQREKTVAEQRAKTEREFRKLSEAAAKEIPDFVESIEGAEDVMISQSMGEAILESPLGPRIMYHLVKNPTEAARISQLSPNAAIREIGKLEASIESALKAQAKPQEGDDGDPKPEPKKQPSKAPEPIEPVSGRGGPGSQTPSDKDDIKSWLAKRNAQLARQGRR